MYRPTISIRTLLAIVAFIALACTALVWANGIWATTLFTAALGVLLFATLAVILRRGVKQAFWIGFALFGWGYLWMAHWPNGDYAFGLTAFGGGGARQWTLQQGKEDSLATTRLLAHAYMKWLPMVRRLPPSPPPTPATVTVGAYDISGTSVATSNAPAFQPDGSNSTFVTSYVAPAPATAPPTPAASYPAMHEFMRVGHSLFIIIFALIGGWLGTILYRTRDAKEKPPALPATAAA
jgi:hypothetical protein